MSVLREKSPDVVLHVDHIKPVSKGGKNTITNLITACRDCNLGKSNVEPSDDAVAKQMTHVQVMAERDEQITMMVTWAESPIASEEKFVVSVEKKLTGCRMGFL